MSTFFEEFVKICFKFKIMVLLCIANRFLL